MDNYLKEFRFEVNGTSVFFRRGGLGRTVLLLHGHTQSSDMWEPLVPTLIGAGFCVVAPDLHGLGRSSVPDVGYKKSSIARDMHLLLDSAGLMNEPITVVGHDLGAFVAYAFAAQFEADVERLVVMEAIIPGIGVWPTLLQQPDTWHFGFYGRYAERLIKGRERIYLDRFWDELSIHSDRITDDARERYTEYYKRSDGIRGALAHFSVFREDERDNAGFALRGLDTPLLGVGGAASLGGVMTEHVDLLSSQATCSIVEDAGHWLMEEQQKTTVQTVLDFLKDKS
ncbi:MAG: alpha/beta hydrolase [Pseudomonadota bacterium]